MKLDVLGVQAFVALAEKGSFGKAADSLFISQGALSRRIRNLEDYLGVTLVDRTTRSLQLSRVGSGFLPQARRLLSELQGALQQIREMRDARGGDVTMACVPTVGVRLLPQVLEAYGAAHPSNRVSVLDHSAEGVARAVLERAAEFGIGIAGMHGPDISAEELLHDRFVMVCRKSHRLAKRSRVAWSELEGLPLILPGAGSSNRPLLDDQLPAGIELHAKFEVQRSATAVGLAAGGAGIAIVPGLALQPGAYPMLSAVPLVRPAASRAFVLLRRRGGSLSPAAEGLVQTIRRETRLARRQPS
jgi:DNA-binding transcriptional LysR family regulator